MSPGAAALTLRTAGTQLAASLDSTTRTDADVRVTLAADKVPTGGGLYLDVIGRRVGVNNELRGRVRLLSSGAVTVSLAALRGTSTVVLIQGELTLPGVTYTPGMQLNVRLQVAGTGPTTLRLKAWPATCSRADRLAAQRHRRHRVVAVGGRGRDLRVPVEQRDERAGRPADERVQRPADRLGVSRDR